jgi:hypothetical protein
MAFPSSGGGYQFTDGNLNEPVVYPIPAPLSQATTATLTAAQLLSGILLVGAGQTAAQTMTLPAVSVLEAVLINPKVGTSFELTFVNTGTSSGTVAMAMGTGTGFTNGGNATVAVAITSSARFVFRKTGDNAYSVYRVA